MSHPQESFPSQNAAPFYDAFLLLAYGGPESEAEVAPFLDALFKGKTIPPHRRAAAEEKYRRLGGKSPLGEECRRFRKNLAQYLKERDSLWDSLKIYGGNLYSPPTIEETVRKIVEDGCRSVLTLISSPFQSPQSRERYCFRLRLAQEAVQRVLGDKITPSFPQFHLIPPFYNHPDFLRAQGDLLLSAIAEESLEALKRDSTWQSQEVSSASHFQEPPLVLFTAHSLPQQDADLADYEGQLLTLGKNLAANVGLGGRVPSFEENKSIPSSQPSDLPPWNLVYQSRSGNPRIPWTGPGIEDFIRDYKEKHPNWDRLAIVPIGFFLENMETVYDLDREAVSYAQNLGIRVRRVPTVGLSERIFKMVFSFLKTSPDSEIFQDS